jgi:hypothetical protein
MDTLWDITADDAHTAEYLITGPYAAPIWLELVVLYIGMKGADAPVAYTVRCPFLFLDKQVQDQISESRRCDADDRIPLNDRSCDRSLDNAWMDLHGSSAIVYDLIFGHRFDERPSGSETPASGDEARRGGMQHSPSRSLCLRGIFQPLVESGGGRDLCARANLALEVPLILPRFPPGTTPHDLDRPGPIQDTTYGWGTTSLLHIPAFWFVELFDVACTRAGMADLDRLEVLLWMQEEGRLSAPTRNLGATFCVAICLQLRLSPRNEFLAFWSHLSACDRLYCSNVEEINGATSKEQGQPQREAQQDRGRGRDEGSSTGGRCHTARARVRPRPGTQWERQRCASRPSDEGSCEPMAELEATTQTMQLVRHGSESHQMDETHDSAGTRLPKICHRAEAAPRCETKELIAQTGYELVKEEIEAGIEKKVEIEIEEYKAKQGEAQNTFKGIGIEAKQITSGTRVIEDTRCSGNGLALTDEAAIIRKGYGSGRGEDSGIGGLTLRGRLTSEGHHCRTDDEGGLTRQGRHTSKWYHCRKEEEGGLTLRGRLTRQHQSGTGGLTLRGRHTRSERLPIRREGKAGDECEDESAEEGNSCKDCGKIAAACTTAATTATICWRAGADESLAPVVVAWRSMEEPTAAGADTEASESCEIAIAIAIDEKLFVLLRYGRGAGEETHGGDLGGKKGEARGGDERRGDEDSKRQNEAGEGGEGQSNAKKGRRSEGRCGITHREAPDGNAGRTAEQRGSRTPDHGGNCFHNQSFRGEGTEDEAAGGRPQRWTLLKAASRGEQPEKCLTSCSVLVCIVLYRVLVAFLDWLLIVWTHGGGCWITAPAIERTGARRKMGCSCISCDTLIFYDSHPPASVQDDLPIRSSIDPGAPRSDHPNRAIYAYICLVCTYILLLYSVLRGLAKVVEQSLRAGGHTGEKHCTPRCSVPLRATATKRVVLMAVIGFALHQGAHSASPGNPHGINETTEGTSGILSASAVTCGGIAWTSSRKRPRRAKTKIMRHTDDDTTNAGVFFSNITAWGPQARRYFRAVIANEDDHDCNWDAIGLVEHHLCDSKLQGLRTTFRQIGYRVGASVGLESVNSANGITGGAAIAVPKSRKTTVQDRKGDDYTGPKLTGEDWAAAILHRRGVSMVFVAAYFLCGPYNEANKRRARAIAELTRLLGLPYVIAADFNRTPEEAMECGLTTDLMGCIITPADTSSTCTSGQGRMLDYWIASPIGALLIKNPRTVPGTPWKPHAGIAFDMKTGAEIMQANVMVRHAKILAPDNVSCKKNHITKATAWHWDMACEQRTTGQREFGKLPKGGDIHSVLDSKAELEIGKWYSEWSAQAAGAIATCNDIESTSRTLRGNWARTKQGPIYGRRRGEAEAPHSISSDPTANLWSGATGQMRAIATHIERCNGVREIERASQWLTTKIAPIIEKIWQPRRHLEWQTDSHNNATTASNINRYQKLLGDVHPELNSGTERQVWVYDQPPPCILARWRVAMSEPRLLQPTEWINMAIETGRMAAVAAKKSKRQGAKYRAEWTREAVSHGAATGHAVCKPRTDCHDPFEQDPTVTGEGQWVFENDPNKIVEARGKSWHIRWARDKDNLQDLKMWLTQQRTLCMAEDETDPITEDHVADGIRKMRADAGVGVDQWSGREWLALPSAAIKELTQLMNAIDNQIAWPAQVLQAIVLLIPKPKGGDRPICLMAAITKLWECIHCGTVLSWEANRIGHWDDAIKGSSSLRAAAVRRLRAEVCTANGDEFLGLLWDAEKFYDNINLSKLAQASIKLGLPRRELILGWSTLLSPRAIRIGNVIGEAHEPATGMTAGLKRANFYARLMLHPILEAMHATIPRAGPRSYVDDLAQLICGEEEDIIELGTRSAKLLTTMLKASDIVISSKSVVVASSINIARLTCDNIMKSTGVQLQAARTGVDLGVDFGGRRRAVGNQLDRHTKADRRNEKILYLHGYCKDAHKLVTTGSIPQRIYGMFVYGCPPARLDAWRRSDCAARGIATSACNTSALALRGGYIDPAVMVPVEQFKLWTKLWATTRPEEKADIQKAWFKIAPKVAAQGWKEAAGTASATILTLAQIGWKAIGPDVFRDIEGNVWMDDGKGHRSLDIEAALEKSAKKQLWKHAATHYGGTGLHDGGDLTAARWLRKQLLKNNRHTEAGLLNTIVDGAAWFNDRLNAADNSVSTACKRCDAGRNCGVAETATHALWDCADNANCEGTAITRSNKLRGKVTPEHECLWTRGIPPRSLTHHTLSGTGLWRRYWKFGDLSLFKQAGKDPKVKLASDGGGGEHATDRRLARVGWSAVVIRLATDDPDCHTVTDWAGVCGGIWGEQTVPRAEVAGLANVLEQISGLDDTEIGIDNAGVIAQFQKGEQAYETTAGDLWARAKRTLSKHTGKINLVKVKSHAAQEHFDEGLSKSWAIANECADILAGYAAMKLEPTREEVEATEKTDGWAISTLLRGIAVLKRSIVLHETEHGKAKRAVIAKTGNNAIAQRKAHLKEAWGKTRHDCSRGTTHTGRAKRGGVQCKLCRAAPIGTTTAALRDFLSSGCKARGDCDLDIDGDATSQSEDEEVEPDWNTAQASSDTPAQAGEHEGIDPHMRLFIAVKRLDATRMQEVKRRRLATEPTSELEYVTELNLRETAERKEQAALTAVEALEAADDETQNAPRDDARPPTAPPCESLHGNLKRQLQELVDTETQRASAAATNDQVNDEGENEHVQQVAKRARTIRRQLARLEWDDQQEVRRVQQMRGLSIVEHGSATVDDPNGAPDSQDTDQADNAFDGNLESWLEELLDNDPRTHGLDDMGTSHCSPCSPAEGDRPFWIDNPPVTPQTAPYTTQARWDETPADNQNLEAHTPADRGSTECARQVRATKKCKPCARCGAKCGEAQHGTGNDINDSASPDQAQQGPVDPRDTQYDDNSATDAFARAVAKRAAEKRALGSSMPSASSQPHVTNTGGHVTRGSKRPNDGAHGTSSQYDGRKKQRAMPTMPANFGLVPSWLRDSPSIGGVAIDPSHIPHLAWNRGITWCWACGAFALEVPNLLRRRCETPSVCGARQLVRLRKGMTPRNSVPWPLEANSDGGLTHLGRPPHAARP